MEDLDNKNNNNNDSSVKELKWKCLVFLFIGLNAIRTLTSYYAGENKDTLVWIAWIVLGCCIFICFDCLRGIRRIKRNK